MVLLSDVVHSIFVCLDIQVLFLFFFMFYVFFNLLRTFILVLFSPCFQGMSERLVEYVLQMKCRLGLGELESTFGHLNLKVSGQKKKCLLARNLRQVGC